MGSVGEWLMVFDVLELELSYANSDGFIERTLTFLKYSVKGIKLAFTEEYDLSLSYVHTADGIPKL